MVYSTLVPLPTSPHPPPTYTLSTNVIFALKCYRGGGGGGGEVEKVHLKTHDSTSGDHL